MDVRRALTLAMICSALTSTVFAAGASAAPQLDASFGKNGIALLPGRAKPRRYAPEVVAEQPDGGLILVRGYALLRLDPTGTLDPSFGRGGTVALPHPAGGEFELAAVTVDPEGRLVVVGTSTPEQAETKPLPLKLNAMGELRVSKRSDVRILRYLPNGTLDPSFGEGGIVESDLGLPTPEYEGVKLSAASALKATGVSIDGSGRLIVTGGALASVTAGGCAHDDFYSSFTYAGFVARFEESGSLDGSFATDGVFGGRSKTEIPLGMEFTTEPVNAPGEEVILQRGYGACSDAAGSLGFFRLGADGRVRSSRGVHDLEGRVVGAAAAADGSTVLLLGPEKGSDAPPRILDLQPDGSPKTTFGHRGEATIPLPEPGWSYVSGLRVAPDGEVFARGTVVPRPARRESGAHWRSRFSLALFGVTADGKPDPRVGHDGLAIEHIPLIHVPEYEETRGLWVDAQSQPTVTIGYRPKGHGPVGLAIARYDLP